MNKETQRKFNEFRSANGFDLARGVMSRGDTSFTRKIVKFKGKFIAGYFGCHSDLTAFNTPCYSPQAWVEKRAKISRLKIAAASGYSLVNEAIRIAEMQGSYWMTIIIKDFAVITSHGEMANLRRRW